MRQVRPSLFLALLLLAPLQAVAAGPDACAERGIATSAVHTQSDVKAFVECAASYLAENGTVEARRAFNEDPRWKDLAAGNYVFVDGIAKSGDEALVHVFPPDPSREGGVWGSSLDGFGTDYYFELHRILSVVDSGWIYYAFTNPGTGRDEPKSSYVIEVDWDGQRAAIGAGVYARDWPGTCYEDEVSAAELGADPGDATLTEFVRCAAMVVESQGYFAKHELESERWSDGSTYVFVLDMMGNQVISGNKLRVNGIAPHEWRSRRARSDQFDGREVINVGDKFGESFVYYQKYDPLTGARRTKVGFLKRVVAQGVPLLVGAGYLVQSDQPPPGLNCESNFVTAAAVRTRSDVKAFVECAAEYAREHGTDEARRAFNEDDRWKHGEIYVFVDGFAQSGEYSVALVNPTDPSREGSAWEQLIDSFGSDYFSEERRVLSLVDAGWIYYDAFSNPLTGLVQLKSSYVIGIDWDGQRAAIGAGTYARDLPGACTPEAVNAAALENHPNENTLMEFVRCASAKVSSAGHFAGPVLESHPRWNHGTIHVFGADIASGTILFSGDLASYDVSGRIPELFFGGRNVIEAAGIFGEMFWYHSFTNPVTGMDQGKVVFVKRALANGVPVLVGSGYNLP